MCQLLLAGTDIDQEELGLVPTELCIVAVERPSHFVCLYILTRAVEPLFWPVPVFRSVLPFEVVDELTATTLVLGLFPVQYINVYPIQFFIVLQKVYLFPRAE